MSRLSPGDTAPDFTLSDVMRAVMAKLVRRHPHVFGDEVAAGTGEVLKNWEAIKQQERRDAGAAAPSALGGVPHAMPALLRAERVQHKAAAVGFDFPDAEGAWDKVVEETREVREALDGSDPDQLEDEIGDLLFAVVNLARMRGVVPETALRGTVDRFSRRFAHVEAGLAAQGRTTQDATLEEMDVLWDDAKRAERTA